jgi:carboxyl-terminal processing protease
VTVLAITLLICLGFEAGMRACPDGAAGALAPVSAAVGAVEAPTGAHQDAPSKGVMQAQERSFDKVLAIVEAIPESMRPAGYAAPDAAAVAALRARARDAQDPGEFRAVVAELLGSTGLSHHAIIPHDAVPDGDAGEGRHGMTLAVIDGHAVVTRVEPGSPAAAAGVEPGWRLMSLSGDPLQMVIAPHLHARTARERLVQQQALETFVTARPGLLVEMEFLDRSGMPRMLDITFDEPTVATIRFGMLPPIPAECSHRVIEPADWTALGLKADGAPRVGVIRLGVWMPALAPCIDGAVDALRTCDAIVMDLRGNPGGIGFMATGVAGHFLTDPVSLGRMIAPDAVLEFPANPRLVDTQGNPVRPFAGPLAILVDGGTASTSEIFAAGMEDHGRAEIFGGPSAGAALPAITTRLDTGDVLLYAIGDFRSARGRAIEGTGVVQGTDAPPSLQDYIDCPDPVLRDALRWIESTYSGHAPASANATAANAAPEQPRTETPAAP